jgi:hypothetical protein
MTLRGFVSHSVKSFAIAANRIAIESKQRRFVDPKYDPSGPLLDF